VNTSKTPAIADIIKAVESTNHDPDNAQQKKAKRVLGGGPIAGLKELMILKKGIATYLYGLGVSY
jgi:hypothetical protein